MRTQVQLADGRWVTSQRSETAADGRFTIQLTYGANTPGETRWRVGGQYPDGEVFSEPFTLTRLGGTIAVAEKKVVRSLGNAWGRFATDRPLTVWSEVQLADGRWVRSQTRTTDEAGSYVVPLTYGAANVGRLRWRIAAQYPRLVVRTAEVEVLRVPNAAALKAHDVRVVGRSLQGREIHALRIGDPNADKTVLFLGSMHGEEPAGTQTIDAMIAHPKLVAGVDLWLIPTMNPDGLAVGRRGNANGVDLNANFPDGWGYRRTKDQYWAGTAAASEPETRAMMDFLQWLQPDQFVSIHQPLYAVDSFAVKDEELMHALSRELSIPIKYLSCKSGTCGGTMTRWHNNLLPGAAITIEYRYTETKEYIEVTARDGLLRAVGARWN